MDVIHRILSGQTMTKRQLICAGLFVASWWLMDIIQFVGWLLGY